MEGGFLQACPNEPIDSFLSRYPPSTTHEIAVGSCWIYVKGPSTLNEQYGDLSLCIQEGLALLEDLEEKTADKSLLKRGDLGRLRKATTTAILDTAKKYHCTSGKWLLFPSSQNVDTIWTIIGSLTAQGRLGSAAKVSTNNGTGSFVICVYASDFSNLDNVKKILTTLKEYQCFGRTISFKPDIFTHLGITSGNMWGLAPSIYTSRDTIFSTPAEPDIITID